MRVLLATDQEALGDALRLFLSERRVEVVGVAADPGGLFALARDTDPDVVIVDWHLARVGPTWSVKGLKGRRPRGVVVLGTAQERAPATAAGADGYAILGDPPDDLLAVIREVMAAPGEPGADADQRDRFSH